MGQAGCDRCLGVRKIFGERRAQRDLRRYRSRGPARSTRLLLEALEDQGVAGATLLDVGGGVGAIPNHLLARGALLAVLVEASPAYVAAAKAEAERQGHSDRTEFREGDFVELAPTLERAAVVTLDRVICCYQDMPRLVSESASRAARLYGLVYPRDAWWNRLLAALVNLFMRLTGSAYRAFVHPQADVERTVIAAGMEAAFVRDLGAWRVAVYCRMESAG